MCLAADCKYTNGWFFGVILLLDRCDPLASRKQATIAGNDQETLRFVYFFVLSTGARDGSLSVSREIRHQDKAGQLLERVNETATCFPWATAIWLVSKLVTQLVSQSVNQSVS